MLIPYVSLFAIFIFLQPALLLQTAKAEPISVFAEDSSFFSIKGRVIEIKNFSGEYSIIKGVKVSIPNTNLVAETDKKGNYELLVPKEMMGKEFEICVHKDKYQSKPFVVNASSFRKSPQLKVTNIMWQEKDAKKDLSGVKSGKQDCPVAQVQKKKPAKKNRRLR